MPGNVPYCVVSSFYLYIQFVVIKSERWVQLIIHRMVGILKINFKISHRIYFLQEESFLQEFCSCLCVCQVCPVPFSCSLVLSPSIQKIPCLIQTFAIDIKTKIVISRYN